MSIQPSTRQSATGFRPEIEGLRGLAVVLVVLFHARLGPFDGGFVGVDVFFVLSGFLITGLLLRERQATGRIDLPAFYARRIRRLAPAAVIVLAVVLALSWRLLDPMSRIDVMADGAAAALSVANLRFATSAGDYFAAQGTPSPFLHFWSLAVEEQFYLLWPALLLVAARLGGRTRGPAMAVALVLAASLPAALLLTDTAPGAAFYLLPTRAWQLAAGALLAIGWVHLERLPRLVATTAGWLGLAGVGSAALLLSASTPYPGLAALLPTAAAAGLIVAGVREGGPGALLAAPPMRFLGRISYALYLWHWPLLVLAAAYAGSALAPGQAIVIVLVSVVLATVSTVAIEEPIRRGVGAGTRRTLASGMALILAMAITGGSLSMVSAAALDGSGWGQASTARIPDAELPPELTDDAPAGADDAPAGVDDAPAGADDAPDGAGGPDATAQPASTLASPDPTASSEPGASPTAPSSPRPARTPKPSRVVTVPPGSAGSAGAGFVPALKAIRSDEEVLKGDGCIAYEPEKQPRDCVYGKGSFTVALVGDSHASALFPAVHAVARQRGWRVVPMVKVACPFLDLPVWSNTLKRTYRECAAFNDAVVERVEALRPDLTLVAMNHWVLPADAAKAKVSIVGAALGRQLQQLPGKVVVLADTPHSGHDVATCLASRPPEKCTTPRASALSGHAAIERVGARAAGVPMIDLAPAICSTDRCGDVVRGMVVYRDYHHLTATFSRSLGPSLNRALGRLGV